PAMSSLRRVLVTGATGFIGRRTLEPLLRRGFEVHAASRRPPQDAPAAVIHHACDLLDQEARQALVQSVAATHLLHLAWFAEPGRFWKSPENLRWTAASIELTRVFAAHGGRRAVFAGTCAEYDWSETLCDEQRTPIRPQSLYGSCKAALWSVLQSAAPVLGITAGWGRLFFLYGEHEHPQRVIPSVILALLRDQPAVCTAGRQVRDFMYVGDVAQAYVSLLDSVVTGPVNIASGEAQPLAETLTLLGQELRKPHLVQLGARPTPPHEPAVLRADISRLRDEVSFRPQVGLREGLQRTIAWWQAQTTGP
ncbi:MAG TPA: NAD(P)-dependent oxidoreductase, partial [bacterium]|nr:NAD(P)-dependent oxidoreductase [bacterium]